MKSLTENHYSTYKHTLLWFTIGLRYSAITHRKNYLMTDGLEFKSVLLEKLSTMLELYVILKLKKLKLGMFQLFRAWIRQ